MGKPADWYCGHCLNGPMDLDLYQSCIFCFRVRDAYSDPLVHQFAGQANQGTSASFSAAHRSKATGGLGRSAGKVDTSSARPTSEGASPKSGSPIDLDHDVTPEETFISLAKTSKHAHGPSVRELPVEEPLDEAQNHKRSDKSAITKDESPIRKDTYEQWIADDILKDISGDTRVTDDVEPKCVSGPSSDAKSGLDSLLGPLTEPRTGGRSSDDPNTSEQTRTELRRGNLLPSLIYMLFVRVCSIVTRLFEPNPLPGRRRIRWRCQCGQMLYDDFIEVRPGALADLEQSLNSTGGFYECNPGSSNATSYVSNRRDRTSPGGWLGSLRWPWKTASVQSPSLPLHERQGALDQVSTQPPADNERRGLCIFLCIPYRRTANKLHPAVVEDVSTDNALFSYLRSIYKTARKESISFLSLKTIKSIRFVRFEVYSQGLVDVRTTPDMPDESRRDEYSYHPMPAEFIPPIGENHMMHLYTYPEEAEHTGICLAKIPKKIEGLAWLPTHSQGSKVGWGLHFVEGLDVAKLWVCGFIGFMLSIMFGIAWSMIKNDMQSGFAVVACMLTGLLFTIGMVQAAYEPK